MINTQLRNVPCMAGAPWLPLPALPSPPCHFLLHSTAAPGAEHPFHAQPRVGKGPRAGTARLPPWHRGCLRLWSPRKLGRAPAMPPGQHGYPHSP